MHYLALFFAGAFLANGIPHLAAGLQGEPFPSPFSTPRGVGDSSPGVNFAWGFLNLLAGTFLLASHPVIIGINAGFGVVLLGFFLLGLFASRHFGKVKRDRRR